MKILRNAFFRHLAIQPRAILALFAEPAADPRGAVNFGIAGSTEHAAKVLFNIG